MIKIPRKFGFIPQFFFFQNQNLDQYQDFTFNCNKYLNYTLYIEDTQQIRFNPQTTSLQAKLENTTTTN